MTRFFFHLIDDVFSQDEEGVELIDAATAHAKAVFIAREIAATEIREGRLSLHHRIEVTDVTGSPILTLPLGAAFEIDG